MERFYLEIPSIERKEQAIEFIKEHILYGSKINGVGGLDKALEEGISYEEWLDEMLKLQNKEYAESKKLVPSTTYFMIRENDNKVIGMVNFRHYLNDFLRNCGGHIGYGIRPTERKKGYAKIQLYLTLLEAKKMEISEVMVDCVNTNIGSSKTIIALGGKFEKEFYVENKKQILNNYWINVKESIEQNREKYIENIRSLKK